MSVRAMADVWYTKLGGPLLYQGRVVYEVEAKAVLLVLADAANGDGLLGCPSLELMARKTGMSADEVLFTLNALRAHGFLLADHAWERGEIVEINLSVIGRMS